MHSQFPVSYQPIRDIQFEGLHLIEASAGTGKTYTLSSLMVRIFLEKYLLANISPSRKILSAKSLLDISDN